MLVVQTIFALIFNRAVHDLNSAGMKSEVRTCAYSHIQPRAKMFHNKKITTEVLRTYAALLGANLA
jgi:hypothetical protein